MLFAKAHGGYFGYGYRVLGEADFPLLTYENGLAVLLLIIEVVVGLTTHVWTWWLVWNAALIFCTQTFIFTAPSLRFDLIRRLYLLGGSCIGAYSNDCVYGGQYKGFYIHLTAERLIETGLVDRKTIESVSSFAVVRNPFARMVSV